MKLRVRTTKFPKGFKPRDAATFPEGAANDYLSKRKPIAAAPYDDRLLGLIPQPDGVLLVFRDGTSVLNLDPAVN